jgi:oligoendopeptidase F
MLGVESLKPWDIGAGRLHEIVVKPYEKKHLTLSPPDVERISRQLLHAVDPAMAALFDEMKQRGEVELESRPGKKAGAYQANLAYAKRPFIFGNNTGIVDDIYTTNHEFGHALHYMDHRDEPLMSYQELPMEAAELGSMTCELLCHQHAELAFDKETANAMRAERYQEMVLFLPYMAQVDAFQHWIYENPTHTAEERRKEWERLADRFGPPIDWRAIEKYKGIIWQQQLHIFRYPFYYIEYGIAQLGALRVEANYKREPGKALRDWRAGLALGASKPLPEIYTTAGITFDFSPTTVELVAKELAKAIALA